MPEMWLLLGLALCGANLPFLLRNPLPSLLAPSLAAARPKGEGKSMWWCLLEWSLMYGIVLGTGIYLEGRLGPIKQQPWQFYATTLCLFIVLAFPGFVYRYLWRRAGV